VPLNPHHCRVRFADTSCTPSSLSIRPKLSSSTAHLASLVAAGVPQLLQCRIQVEADRQLHTALVREAQCDVAAQVSSQVHQEGFTARVDVGLQGGLQPGRDRQQGSVRVCLGRALLKSLNSCSLKTRHVGEGTATDVPPPAGQVVGLIAMIIKTHW